MRSCRAGVPLLLLLPAAPSGPAGAQAESGEFLRRSITLGSASGAIGAALNRDSGQAWWNALLRGAAKGAVGGYLIHEGKHLARRIVLQDRLEHAWVARGVHATGVSIVENAAANRAMLQKWRMNVGYVRVEVTTSPASVGLKVLPGALLATLDLAGRAELDPSASLRMGTVVFRTDRLASPFGYVMARARGNSFEYRMVRGRRYDSAILAHELVHTMQYDDFAAATYFLKAGSDRLASRWRPYEMASRWIHPDVTYVLFRSAYSMLSGDGFASYCRNYFEREARALVPDRASLC